MPVSNPGTAGANYEAITDSRSRGGGSSNWHRDLGMWRESGSADTSPECCTTTVSRRASTTE
jgi:hypothetical protein